MGREHFTGLRLDEVLPLIERDAMSDEEMVAYLARCQLDPAMPRCSIETLLHAFVPAPHVHHTHPDGINVLAGHRRRRAARARVLRRRGGVDPVHPPRLHALQAGRRGGAREPGPQARRARQARPRRVGRQRRGGVPAHDRGDQPGGRVRQRAHARRAALRRLVARPRRRRPTRAALLRELLPAIRGAVSSERAQGADRRHVRAPARVRRLGPGRAARHRRRAVPRPPRAHEARPAVDPLRPGRRRRGRAARPDRRARGRVPRRLPRLRRRPRRRRTRSRPTRTRGSCWSSTSGSSRRARRRRTRGSRATSTTARSR